MTSPILADLPFIDLYVRLDDYAPPLYRSKESDKQNESQFVPDVHCPAADRFAAAIKATMKGSDGAIDFENVRCRLSRVEMADGTVWACARRINTEIPDMRKLGYVPHVYNHMHSLGRRDGLILLSGATGHGKTTTAVALLADYLRTFGGTAITIEDPVEYMLKGRHGESGQCFQIEVHEDEDWAIGIKRSLRWAPRYIFVGEIRTPKAAEQLLRAASTGHLVLTTVHAGTPEEALMGLLFLAEQSIGGDSASNLLAGSLTALVHQTLRKTGPFVRYLYTEENAPGDPIRSLIRERKIGMISTYIDRISARLSHQSVAPSHMTKDKR